MSEQQAARLSAAERADDDACEALFYALREHFDPGDLDPMLRDEPDMQPGISDGLLAAVRAVRDAFSAHHSAAVAADRLSPDDFDQLLADFAEAVSAADAGIGDEAAAEEREELRHWLTSHYRRAHHPAAAAGERESRTDADRATAHITSALDCIDSWPVDTGAIVDHLRAAVEYLADPAAGERAERLRERAERLRWVAVSAAEYDHDTLRRAIYALHYGDLADNIAAPDGGDGGST